MRSNRDKIENNKGLIRWFIENHVAANILMIFIALGGLIMLSGMVREIFPSIDPKTITVSVPYPAASPEDIEDGITRRIEEAVLGIQGIKRVVSNASEGIGSVTIELEDFVDGNIVLNDVETEIDSLQDFPPEDAEDVTIVKAKSNSSVLSLVVYGNVPELTLRDWADRIKEDLMLLPNVSLVNFFGTKNREISIEISENSLRKYNLTIGEVADRINNFSVNLPGGTIRAKNSEILVRVNDKRYYGKEFEDIVIKNQTNGSFLRLKDIAKITDGFEDSKFLNQFNNQNAISINVTRSSSQDTIEIDREVKEYIKNLKLPEGVNLTISKNRTTILRDRMDLLTRNAILGFALVFMALVLFLDLKLAFWTSLAIPVSFLGGLFIAAIMGVTINMITLFALIVVLGVVVDDAIIAGESVFSEQEKNKNAGKKNGIFSALKGIESVRAPVTIGVLTTIAAFAPLAFSTGTLGQILAPIPVIVIGVLLVSLIEAFFILPSHLSSPNRWSVGILASWREKVSKLLEYFIENVLSPLAKTLISFRYITLTASFIIIFFAIWLAASGNLRFIFFPQIEGNDVVATLEMPIGTSFETTEKYTKKMVQAAEETRSHFKEGNKDIFKNLTVTVGEVLRDGNGPGAEDASGKSSHLSQVNIELIESDERTSSAKQVEGYFKKQIGEIPGAKKLSFESSLVRAGSDITVELSHRDSDKLAEASKGLMALMRESEEISEIGESSQIGKREFIFDINNVGLAAGLTSTDIGRQLRDAFYGREIQRIQRGSNEIKVLVRYPAKERNSLVTIENMRIRLPNGEEAKLTTVADIREGRSLSTIERVDGRRVNTITADVDKSLSTPNEANEKIVNDLMPKVIEKYPDLKFSLEGKSRDQAEDMATLGKNLGIAMMIIFVMLAGQLRSYAKPFVILSTVPIGIAGAIFGHVLLGFDLSFISFFGIVALSGVVINDSVVLVDYYNHLRSEGEEAYQAVIESIEKRFRPILLTTLTTSLGLLPMLLETSLQAQFIIPMAVSLACGIIFASAMLIFVVPCLLMVIEDVKEKCFREKYI